jgi:hypothetical protein
VHRKVGIDSYGTDLARRAGTAATGNKLGGGEVAVLIKLLVIVADVLPLVFPGKGVGVAGAVVCVADCVDQVNA